MSTRRHAALLFALAATLAGLLTICLLRVIIPRAAALDLPATDPLGQPFTRHLALVVIDGLRYDFASDPGLMPELSRRMRERASGEIWANPVSMTSSAVLTYGTGQRGDLDQIVNNESGVAVRYNHLMANIRAAGMTTACAGDHAWFQLYAGAWDLAQPDPAGVAIDVDYNDQIFAAAHRFLRHDPRPSLLVVHFVTPDHQAHAYGPRSERYRSHLRAFDRTLADLLAAIPSDTTVFITSDHGATDTGTHGSDTPVQRLSPLIAYGPGIVDGRRETRPLDQVDLPATFAALLGVPPPTQSRGHVLVDWLDAPDSRRAEIACHDLARLATYAGAAVGPEAVERAGVEAACQGADPRTRIAAASVSAAALDREIGDSTAAGSRRGWMVPCLALAGALAIAVLVLLRAGVRPRPIAVGAGLALSTILSATAVIFGIERLPGKAPLAVYAVLSAAAHVGLLASLLRARRAAAWLDRNAAIGAAIIPGLLVVTYTKTTQPESFVAAAVIAAFALTVGFPETAAGAPQPSRRWQVGPIAAIATALLFLALAPIAIFEDGYLPEALVRNERVLLATAVASIALFGAQRHLAEAAGSTRRPRTAWTVAGIVIAAASLVLRRSAPWPICVGAWLGLGAVAFVAARRIPRTLVELFALGSYAWVSRDEEIPIVLATYVVATVVADAAARGGPGDVSTSARAAVVPSRVLLLITFAFAWTYLQRIGVELGVDFVHLDWGAGAFRDAGVGILRIGCALAYKHGLARACILFAILAPLAPAYRLWVARGVFMAESVRVAMLVTTLFVSRTSFWTSMRTLGDLPHALLAVVVAAAAYAVVVLRHDVRDWSFAPGAPAGEPVTPLGTSRSP